VPENEVDVTGTVIQTSNPNIVFHTMIKIVNKLRQKDPQGITVYFK